MDLYEILELKPHASTMDIKRAYHRLAKQYHPDKNHMKDTTIEFQKIQSAYEILINDETRESYIRMNKKEKESFIDILRKVINNEISIDELGHYATKFEKMDFEYIKKNFINFFKLVNTSELLNMFKNGIVKRKQFNNMTDCSESELEIYDETCAEYYHTLPISIMKGTPLDIKMEINIKIGDIASNNKKKIKIKRSIDGELETMTFIFNLSEQYIVFMGAGDMDDCVYGNLIIKLKLPNNLYWNEKLILIEQPISLYEMIYGLDICLDLGENKIINIERWVASRDGFLIEMNKNNNVKINFKLEKYTLAIKLNINYEDTLEKQNILMQYFS